MCAWALLPQRGNLPRWQQPSSESGLARCFPTHDSKERTHAMFVCGEGPLPMAHFLFSHAARWHAFC
jgi:hypothetical protein